MFRHRAPLFISSVNRNELRLEGDSERILIPRRGRSTMGNFGVTRITTDETWITTQEGIHVREPEDGYRGTILVARIRW